MCVQARITWLSVWEYALQEVQVATILRRLLDDAHMSVVTAAAEAMAVLVGPGPEEEEVWEAAHCNPATGRRTCDCAGMMTKRQNTGIIALGREVVIFVQHVAFLSSFCHSVHGRSAHVQHQCKQGKH